MNDLSLKVFDDHIVGPTPVFSALAHDASLSGADQLGIHAIIDDAVGEELSLSIRIEHSRDGVQEDSGAGIVGHRWQPLSLHPEIFERPIARTGTTSLYGGEAWPARPRHRHVRLRIQLHANERLAARLSSPFAFSARVVVMVSCRTRSRSSKLHVEHGESTAVEELNALATACEGLHPEAKRAFILANASPQATEMLTRAVRDRRARAPKRIERLKKRMTEALARVDGACTDCAGRGDG